MSSRFVGEPGIALAREVREAADLLRRQTEGTTWAAFMAMCAGVHGALEQVMAHADDYRGADRIPWTEDSIGKIADDFSVPDTIEEEGDDPSAAV